MRNRNLFANAALGPYSFNADESRPDTYLAVLPLFHIFGQTVIQNGGILYGGTIVYLPRFEAVPALQLLLKEKVSFFAGVPTMYWGLLGALSDPAAADIDVAEIAKNLRVAAAGGVRRCPATSIASSVKKFGVTILEGYGLSETSPVASFSVWGEDPVVGSIGKPVEGVEMKLVDADHHDLPEDPEAIGEIAIKGHGIMKGYYNRPAATAGPSTPSSWFYSVTLRARMPTATTSSSTVPRT